jgi:hypothetical protein
MVIIQSEKTCRTHRTHLLSAHCLTFLQASSTHQNQSNALHAPMRVSSLRGAVSLHLKAQLQHKILDLYFRKYRLTLSRVILRYQ